MPLLKRIRANEAFDLHVTNASGLDADEVVTHELAEFKPHLVLCPFDRPEMAKVAYIAYHQRFPIVQLFAGDIAGGAFDDADRFVISCYADICFTADWPQYNRLQKFMLWKKAIGLPATISVSGATHFDDMEYEEFNHNLYAVVLYNPPSMLTEGQMQNELNAIADTIWKETKDQYPTYWVGPNKDPGSDKVVEFAWSLEKKQNVVYIDDMRRRKFLGLLKKATVAIGNSSSFFYEAPYFHVPVKQIGVRNKYREPISRQLCKPGASDEIINRMLAYLNLRKKKLEAKE